MHHFRRWDNSVSNWRAAPVLSVSCCRYLVNFVTPFTKHELLLFRPDQSKKRSRQRTATQRLGNARTHRTAYSDGNRYRTQRSCGTNPRLVSCTSHSAASGTAAAETVVLYELCTTGSRKCVGLYVLRLESHRTQKVLPSVRSRTHS